MIGLEPINRFETNFINRDDQALALAKDVGRTAVWLPGHIPHQSRRRSLAQAIRNGGDKLVAFHVADNNRLACGQGAIDWEGIVSTLGEIGYDDYLTVEFVVPVDRSPLSQRTEIADAADAGASQGMEQFLRDHGTGTVPEHYYDRYVQDSIDRLRKAIDVVGAAA